MTPLNTKCTGAGGKLRKKSRKIRGGPQYEMDGAGNAQNDKKGQTGKSKPRPKILGEYSNFVRKRNEGRGLENRFAGLAPPTRGYTKGERERANTHTRTHTRSHRERRTHT